MARIVDSAERQMRIENGKVHFLTSHFNTQAAATAWKNAVISQPWMTEMWFRWQIVLIRNDYFAVKIWYQRNYRAGSGASADD